MLLIGDDSLTLDSDTVFIEKIDDVFVKVDAEFGIRQELVEYFTFMVPGYTFMPAYRNKMWDGKIRLYNNMNKTLYTGLIPYIYKFAEERKYKIENAALDTEENFTTEDAIAYCKELTLPFEVRDYQIEAFVHAIRKKRALLLSPTASGKSLIIYLMVRYLDLKTLIIVPTTSLVYQLEKDFVEYGMDPDIIHTVSAGHAKTSDKKIVISTWQSQHKINKSEMQGYDLLVGDEAHLFKAKSLTNIMSKLIDCPYRFGMTGTLDGTTTHRLVLEGLFGPVKHVTRTSELIEKKQLADFDIDGCVLEYPKDERALAKAWDYNGEIGYLISHEKRNKFITNLCVNLEGNSLVLFQRVEAHGRILYDMIREKANDGAFVYFVHGGTAAETREEIRTTVEEQTNAIIVASYGVFSTGVNIRNLDNIVFASPSKSRIRNLQSIGRGLRRSDTKSKARLLDIADDFSTKGYKNYTLKHFMERLKIYRSEKFPYKIHSVKMR